MSDSSPLTFPVQRLRLTNHVRHRKVCLKHRKNRRETIPAGASSQPSWQRCLFFLSLNRGAGVRQFATRAASSFFFFCDHRSTAGPLGANQGMPVRLRLIAPFSNTAGASLRSGASKTLRARGSTETPCHFNPLRGRQVVRQRPHKPFTRWFDSSPRNQFQYPGPLDHSGGHLPRKQESTVQSRGGPPFQNNGLLAA